MINVKDQVYSALLRVSENASDMFPLVEPRDSELPIVVYCEEANNVYQKTDDAEQLATLRYRVDIFDKKSTSETAQAIDAELSALGLTRDECYDVQDATDYRHKCMRYSGIIDVETEQMYWTNNR